MGISEGHIQVAEFKSAFKPLKYDDDESMIKEVDDEWEIEES